MLNENRMTVEEGVVRINANTDFMTKKLKIKARYASMSGK